MTGIISNTKKKGQDLAKDMARQIAREPLEILKSAGEQVVGTQETKPDEQPQASSEQKPTTPKNEALEKHLVSQGQSQIQALEQEMKEIRILRENQEQQKQATANQPAPETPGPLIEPTPIPKKGMFRSLGSKLQAKRQKERVENPTNQG
jgi:hypothetical protein